MPTERDFLRAIADEPDDDSLRLIFADWLEDHDKPAWSALIRRQIAARPVDPDGFHLPWWLTPFATRPIEKQVAAEMAYPVPLDEAVCRRGLIDHLTVSMETLLEAGEELVAWGPVPMVQPKGIASDVTALARWQVPSGLTRLNLHGSRLNDDGLETLGGSRLFAGLTELCLMQATSSSTGNVNCLSAAAAGILARADGLRSLRVLDMSGVPLGDAGLLELSRCVGLRGLNWLRLGYCRITGLVFGAPGVDVPWPELRTLDLSGNRFEQAGAICLAQSEQLGSVRRLDLGYTDFPDHAAVVLGCSSHPVNLRELILTGNQIAEQGFLAILESGALAGLRRLKMPASLDRSRRPTVHDREAAALAHATFAEQVEMLDLENHPVGDAGVLGLVRSGRYTRLKELTLGQCALGLTGARALLDWALAGSVKVDVGHNTLGPEGVECIVRLACQHVLPEHRVSLNLHGMSLGDLGIDRLTALPELARCSEVDLMRNGLSAAAGQRLASCPAVANLTRLNLGSNPIGDPGAAALASSPYLERLKVLELGDCNLTDAGVVALVGSPALPALEELVLFANQLTDVSALALVGGALPMLKEVHLDRDQFGRAAWTGLEQRFGQGLHAY